MGFEEYMLCGTLDQLYYNKKYNAFQIWDWKSNEEIDYKSHNGEKLIGFDIEACNFEMYSLQLSFYWYFLDKIGIPVVNAYIGHFVEDKEDANLILCKDYRGVVHHLLEERRLEIIELNNINR